MSVEQFNPSDPKYKKVEDLPEEERGNFKDIFFGEGFVRKTAIDNAFKLAENQAREIEKFAGEEKCKRNEEEGDPTRDDYEKGEQHQNIIREIKSLIKDEKMIKRNKLFLKGDEEAADKVFEQKDTEEDYENAKRKIENMEKPFSINLISKYPIEEIITDLEEQLNKLEEKQKKLKNGVTIHGISGYKNEIEFLKDINIGGKYYKLRSEKILLDNKDNLKQFIHYIMNMGSHARVTVPSLSVDSNTLNIELDYVSKEDRDKLFKIEHEKLAKEATDENCLKKVIKEVENSQLRGTTTRSPGVEFGYQWQKEAPKKIWDILEGKNFTDLGAGDYKYLASYFGSNSHSPEINAVDVSGKNFDEKMFGKVNGIREDMLRFVSKLSDNYGNFTINGIDTNIISNTKYIDYLLFHLNRCVPSGGVVFGINTWFLKRLEEEYGFKDITEEVTGHASSRSANEKKIYQKP